MSIELSQEEADILFNIKKLYTGKELPVQFPGCGGKKSLNFQSENGREFFTLTIFKGSVDMYKVSMTHIGRKTIVLARLDLNQTHRNPDGECIRGNHLHIYRADYGDKFAVPIPPFFENCKKTLDFLDKFMDYCHIIKKPEIQEDLFL